MASHCKICGGGSCGVICGGYARPESLMDAPLAAAPRDVDPVAQARAGCDATPVKRAQAHTGRAQAHTPTGVLRAPCPCGCGEVIDWRPIWPKPKGVHRAKAYRQQQQRERKVSA